MPDDTWMKVCAGCHRPIDIRPLDEGEERSFVCRQRGGVLGTQHREAFHPHCVPEEGRHAPA